ncbi:MAG: flagellar hook-length control protein FliK [Armatimonadetes bacterium]|nr:flagellar hook-length control protein FliK [Armatimonadota bacterium]
MRIESVPGRISIPAQEAGPSQIVFRPGQWLRASVVSADGETALLDFEGVSVRVRPLVPLEAGMQVNLEVLSASSDQVILRIGSPGSGLQSDPALLLSRIGMPATPGNRQAALALLRFGLPLTAEEMTAVTQAVRTGLAGGPEEAAYARSLGLPLTQEVFVALRDKQRIIGSLWQAQSEGEALQSLSVSPDAEDPAGAMLQALRLLARSLEHKLLHGGFDPAADIKAALLRAAENGVDVGEWLQVLHSQQFVNLPRPDGTHPFLYFQFPIRLAEGMQTGELRIEREGEGGMEGDGPLQATLRLATANLGVIEARLTLSGRAMACLVRCERPAAARLCRQAGDALRQALAFGDRYSVAPVQVAAGGVFADLRAEPGRAVLRLNAMI